MFPNSVAEFELEIPTLPGIVTPDPALPPTDGAYRTAADVHAEFIGSDLQIVLRDIIHRPFATPQPVVTIVGADELEQFESSLTATAVITSLQYGLFDVEVPLKLTGPVTTIVFGKADNTTGTFDTEIISMSLTGDLSIPGGPTFPVMIQTAMDLPSPGQTTITDLGGGQYHIDSFFDVFTEISVDGGPTILATAPARVELGSEPVVVSLTGLTKVVVYFDGAVEGSADDSDGDGLDDVVTEMVELDLTGFHPAVGNIHVTLHPTIPSRGEIEETFNFSDGVLDVSPFGPAGSTATSKFALYFQVEMNGQTFFTEQPKLMSTVITHKPPVPGDVYEGLDAIPLISEFGFETPYRLGAARHEPAPYAEVVGRHIFYNNSSFDGNDPLPNENDDGAIAPDKTALLPGQTATFANYTSYLLGINGIMIDVSALPSRVVEEGLDPSNFEFRVGNNNDLATWEVVQDPGLQVTVRPGAGVENSYRVTLTWPDHVARKQWLQVTMLATPDTTLEYPDVFYYGNAVGETGDMTTDAKVNAYDVLETRGNPRPFFDPAELDTVHDFNRDRRVNAIDTLIARSNQTHFLNALRLIDLATDPTAPSPIFDADLADLVTQTGRTAVLDRVFDEQAGLEDIAVAKLQWIHQFESTEQSGSSRKNQPARAVDELMAIFGF